MKCCKPKYEPFEFPIEDNSKTIVNYSLGQYLLDYCPQCDSICELKHKVICEFMNIISKLKCGIQPDLENLLQEISIIYINDTILFK